MKNELEIHKKYQILKECLFDFNGPMLTDYAKGFFAALKWVLDIRIDK